MTHLKKKDRKSGSLLTSQSALSLTNSERQGFITYSKQNKKSKRRYAFLHKHAIYFFSDDSGKRPKFIMNLKKDYNTLEVISKEKFTIKLFGDKLKVTLKFANEEEMDSWVTSIDKTLSSIRDIEGRYKAGVRRNENFLFVKVSEGKQLDPTLDTYVSIYTDGYQKNRTNTSYKQEHPIFDQEFEFVLDDMVQTISLCVKDENSKSILGQVTLPINELNHQEPHQAWFPLSSADNLGVVSGEVQYECSLDENDNTLHVHVSEIKNLDPKEIENRYMRIFVGEETYDIPFTTSIPHTEIINIPSSNPSGFITSVFDNGKGEDLILGQCDFTFYELSVAADHKIQTSILMRSTIPKEALGTIRCTLQFQQSHILEDKAYDDLLLALMADKMAITKKLSTITVLNEKTVSECLVKAFEVKKSGVHYLKQIVSHEIQNTEDPEIIFRGNTLATRSVDSYMKLTGSEYLKHVLQDIIFEIIDNSLKKSCEMDIYRLDPNLKEDKKKKVIKKNMETLIYYTNKFFNAIRESLSLIPMNFRNVFEHIQSEIIAKFPDNEISKYRGIGGFIFLRFFGPAIITPKFYDLVEGTYPTNIYK
eukprot:TRINITY_DN4227_c0_g1_i2.p1 TRINITY_DN4227_c0_g1~~TRINITY_DN4227_c0_g1_i2.p1  ORF type:complete len:591 (+),score=114.67 TRINITY_DN4227_c0_g1_i2:112-1884(+)